LNTGLNATSATYRITCKVANTTWDVFKNEVDIGDLTTGVTFTDSDNNLSFKIEDVGTDYVVGDTYVFVAFKSAGNANVQKFLTMMQDGDKFTVDSGKNLEIKGGGATSTDITIVGQGGSSGWLSGWDKRVKMTIDHNDISNPLSGFPFLIYLSTSSGRNADDVSFVFDELTTYENRKKIAVTKSDGTTQLYVEIEKWSTTTEKAWLWVNATGTNSISSTTDTDLYLYYDKDQADNTTYVGDTNSTPAENVWDSNFKMVQHLVDVTTSTVKDSTAYNNDGTKTVGNQPKELDGKIAKAQDFSSSTNDRINCGTSDSLNIYTGALTLEAWASTTQIYDNTLITKYNHTVISSWNGYAFGIGTLAGSGTQDRPGRISYWPGNWSSYGWAYSSTSVADGQWHLVSVVHSGTTAYFYLDGSPDGTSTVGTRTSTTTNNADLGWDYMSLMGYRNLDGYLDEARVSNTARSAAWIKATYETERDHLLDFGSEESTSTGGTSSWNFACLGTCNIQESTWNWPQFSNGTTTVLNTTLNNETVTSTAILNVDWYLGAHLVDQMVTSINIANATTTISENSTSSQPMVWKWQGSSWGNPSTTQTTLTNASGLIPQPGTNGAIRVREYSRTSSSYTFYKYNLQVDWVTQGASNYGEYDYHDDQGGKYITSVSSTESTTTLDKSISLNWLRYDIDVNNQEPQLNEPPNWGTWYCGLLSGLTVSLEPLSVDLGELNLSNNYTTSTGTTTIGITTSASNGYIITAWAINDGKLKLENLNIYIDKWSGSNATPTDWANKCTDPQQECGFGYNTNDSNLTGGVADRFIKTDGNCGSDNKCWAGFAISGPGEPVGDFTAPTSSATTTISYRVSISNIQAAGKYQTTLIYIVTANY